VIDSLVRDAVAGDRFAFARLVEGESNAAYRAALSILRSPEEACDVVQETAIVAWQHLPRLQNPAAWPGWFRRIAVRLALDERRHARHSREVPWSAEMDFPSDPTSAGEDGASLLSAFSRLSAPERALLALRYQLDLSVPDVAAALGIPEGTVKSRLSRAIARLRRDLGDDDV